DTKDDPVKNYKHLENDKSNKFTKFPSFLQIRWAVISKTQMKNTKKLFHRGQQKTDAKDMKEAEDAERREKNLEDAKKIVIENNPSLPDPQTAKIYQLEDLRGKRVKVFGWVHRLRRQGKNLLFIVLRDGTGFLQCLLTDNPDLVCAVVDRVLKSPITPLLYDLNPVRPLTSSYMILHYQMNSCRFKLQGDLQQADLHTHTQIYRSVQSGP
uniref:OB domain-containing protein n=1 Tax=Electrophorus electricus TaxID=8005 RepID=A0A4W4EJB8_ELEEL